MQANMAENKVIVAFDEDICYFLNQDLNLKNVKGIGEQCEGLYYYNDKCIKSNTSTLRFQCMLSQHDWHYRLGHLVNPVLNVLKDSLNIDKKDNTISNDDERVANDLDKDKSNSTSSSVFGSNINTADFPVDSGNDVDSSDNIVATQNEEVATLEENIFSESNLDNHPSSSQGVQNVRRSSRQSVFLRNYNDFVVESKVKYGLEKYVEMNALLRNDTWELVDLPEGRKAIGSKWIYKSKSRYSGEIDRYKYRLVAQGFRQKEEINYEETFSSVVKMETIRCLLNIVVSMSWLLDSGNAKLTSTLIENGFSQSKSDYSLYTKSDKGVFLALLVYVDDIIITGNSISEIEKFKVFLKCKFMIKDLGKLKYFLGIEVVDTDKGICLNQRKYVLDLLSKYGMLACKPAKTPLMSKLVISNEANNKDLLLKNFFDYQKLMGKLIYLTNTRPDISYDVHCLSQFMHSPLTSHLKIAFKILRYLRVVQVWEFILLRLLVDSANQITNILTKGLDTVKHLELVKRLGMYNVYQVETKGDIKIIVSCGKHKVQGLIV
ncbi:ribonuclease H-like domain-containing protein [Tanacetum coccineum]